MRVRLVSREADGAIYEIYEFDLAYTTRGKFRAGAQFMLDSMLEELKRGRVANVTIERIPDETRE